jgi:hypothetical protein
VSLRCYHDIRHTAVSWQYCASGPRLKGKSVLDILNILPAGWVDVQLPRLPGEM